MRKRPVFQVLVLLVLAVLITTTAVSASGGPGSSGMYSGQTIMNVSGTDANVAVDVYDSTDSTKTYSLGFTVPAGGSHTFFTSDVPGLPVGFQGSAVVSSDQDIKAIVNVNNRPNGSNGVAGGTAAGQYRGVDASRTGTTVAFPLAKAAYGVKSTAFYIQNAGQANASFKAVFLMGTSLTDMSPISYTYNSPSLIPGQMAVIIPADAGVPNSRIGSLTVTAAQPLAGVVLEYETTTNPAKILQATTGFTPNDFATTVLYPVVKKQLGGRSTGLQVQNVTSGSVDVTMVYHGAGGTCPTQTYTETVRTLVGSQSTTYLDSALLPAGCLASAVATATGNIAGVVNESYLPCTGSCVQRATTYAAFPVTATSVTTKVVAPVFKQDFGLKRSGMTIMNTTNVAATATVVFQVGTTTYTYNNLAIPASGSALLLDLSNTTAFPGANWAGGTRMPNASLAAVTITSDQPIIGLVNEAALPGLSQDTINYEAFNVAP